MEDVHMPPDDHTDLDKNGDKPPADEESDTNRSEGKRRGWTPTGREKLTCLCYAIFLFAAGLLFMYLSGCFENKEIRLDPWTRFWLRFNLQTAPAVPMKATDD